MKPLRRFVFIPIILFGLTTPNLILASPGGETGTAAPSQFQATQKDVPVATPTPSVPTAAHLSEPLPTMRSAAPAPGPRHHRPRHASSVHTPPAHSPPRSPRVRHTWWRCDTDFKGEALAFDDQSTFAPPGELATYRSFLNIGFCMHLGRWRRHQATSCYPGGRRNSAAYDEGLHNASLLACRCAFHLRAGFMPLTRTFSAEQAVHTPVSHSFGGNPVVNPDEIKDCSEFLHGWLPHSTASVQPTPEAPTRTPGGYALPAQ